MIKVIAVDFGGVYFTGTFDKIARKISSALGIDHGTTRKALGVRMRDVQVQRITENEYWDHFCRSIGRDIDRDFLRKLTYGQFGPKKPVINLMKRLRKKYKIVLLSNNTIWLDNLDKKYGIYKNFDFVLSSHIVRMQKPDQEIFELLLKKTKAKPDETVFIDDFEENILAARKMGINCILFRNVRQLRKELAAFGVRA